MVLVVKELQTFLDEKSFQFVKASVTPFARKILKLAIFFLETDSCIPLARNMVDRRMNK